MDTQKFIHILLQMKPYSRVKYSWELSYTWLVFFWIGAGQGNWPQMSQIMGINTQKVVQSVKLYILHYMKPYTNSNSIEGWFTPVLAYLGNWGKLERFVPKSSFIGINAQKDIHSVKLHISHQIKPYLSVKATWGSILVLCNCRIGVSWQNLTQLPQIMGRDTQKVIEVWNSKFHIRWSLTQR